MKFCVCQNVILSHERRINALLEQKVNSYSLEYEQQLQRYEKEITGLEDKICRMSVELSSRAKCCVCLSKDVDSVFIRCGHAAVCYECSMGCFKCPICRSQSNVVRLFQD